MGDLLVSSAEEDHKHPQWIVVTSCVSQSRSSLVDIWTGYITVWVVYIWRPNNGTILFAFFLLKKKNLIAAHQLTGRPRLELFDFSVLLRVPLCTIGSRLFSVGHVLLLR